MAAKPLTSEAIALTEKKMDMTLDDLIKMSKKSTSNVKKQRASIKNNNFLSGATSQGTSSKVRRFMDSRSSFRKGALAQKRSNFQRNQFSLATEVARKAAAAPINNRPFYPNRLANWTKQRVAAPLVQRKTFERGFVRKQQQTKMVPKQRHQTLDSLFADMKEQRMRVLSQENNPRLVRDSNQQQWRRGRFQLLW